jgi:DNA-binding winged helix-turn-helix (wHTH) protein
MKNLKELPAIHDAPAADCYEFGPFHLDLRRRQLLRGEEVLALTPKAFDLLQVLVTHADRVVEKDELMRRIWPDSYVGEDSLTQNVAVLRKVLGDASDSPRYIATIHKHGYRFVAALRELHAPEAAAQLAAARPAVTLALAPSGAPISVAEDRGEPPAPCGRARGLEGCPMGGGWRGGRRAPVRRHVARRRSKPRAWSGPDAVRGDGARKHDARLGRFPALTAATAFIADRGGRSLL